MKACHEEKLIPHKTNGYVVVSWDKKKKRQKRETLSLNEVIGYTRYMWDNKSKSRDTKENLILGGFTTVRKLLWDKSIKEKERFPYPMHPCYDKERAAG